MSTYIFPFNSCEPAYDESFAVAQPVSAATNLITVALLVQTSFKAVCIQVRMCIVTFAVFEMVHALSHVHWHESQAAVIHCTVYVMGFGGILPALRRLTSTRPAWQSNLVIVAATAVDVVTVVNTRAKGLAPITTGVALLAVITFSRVQCMPLSIRKRFIRLALGVVLVILLLASEAINCKSMLDFARLPYHLLVESVGLVLFVYMANTFIEWEVGHPLAPCSLLK